MYFRIEKASQGLGWVAVQNIEPGIVLSGVYSPGPDGMLIHFLNHKCEPNAVIVRGSVYTCHYVNKGDEIGIDYATILFPAEPWDFLCFCGARICRRRIVATPEQRERATKAKVSGATKTRGLW